MARILIVLPILTLGGAEWQGFLAAKHLASQGHDVRIWSFESPGIPTPLAGLIREANLPLLVLPYPSIWSWCSLCLGNTPWRNIKILRRHFSEVREYRRHLPPETFDVVIPFTAPASFFVTLFAAQMGRPIVYWNHRGGMSTGGFLYNRFLKGLVLLRRTRFLCNSAEGAAFLAKTFNIKLSTVTIIPNFVDIDPYPDEILHERAPPADPAKSTPLLVHLANIYPEKDIETLIRAAPLLRSSGTAFRLMFIGRNVDAERTRAIESLLKDHIRGDAAVFAGALDRERVADYLKSAAIGLLSSRSEGCPNAVLEYMVAGLPVVATDIPSIRHLLPPESRTFLFPVGDPEACARAITTLVRDPMLRHRIGCLNREHAIKQFSPVITAQRWEQLVRSTVSTSHSVMDLAHR